MMEHKTLGTHISSGFMRFIPFIIVYSVLLALGSFDWGLSLFFSTSSEYFYYVLIPVLSGLLAFSISGYKSVIFAVVLGAISDYLGMGFLGALFVGLSVGYLIRYMESLISIQHQRWSTVIKDVVSPLIISVVIGVILWFVVAPPVAYGLNALTDLLLNLKQGSTIVLVMVLGALTVADLGGPLNKTSYAFSLGAFLEGLYHITGPAVIAVSIPPLSVAMVAYIFPKLFTKKEVDQRRRTFILGTIGLTEGALPYAAQSPLSIMPAVIIGTALTTGLAAYLNLSSTMLVGALPGIVGTSNVLLFLLVHAIGITITAALIVLFKTFRKKKVINND